jgi:hypothetical protein
MYRDALPTMIERWRRLEADVRERSERIGRRGWRWLPQETRERVEALRARGSREPVGLDDALSAIDALTRCLAALDEALDGIDDPSLPWNRPSREWPALGFPWMRALDPSVAEATSAALGDEAQRALAQTVSAIARRMDPGATLDAVHLPGARVRFRAEGAPMVLDVWSVEGGGFWSGPRVLLGLLTTARRSAPRLVLRPAGAGLGRSGRGAVTGDPDFDGRFVWEGEPGATDVLRDPELRRGLATVSLDDVPTLAVDDGLASLRWAFAPTSRSVGAATAALCIVRGA